MEAKGVFNEFAYGRGTESVSFRRIFAFAGVISQDQGET